MYKFCKKQICFSLVIVFAMMNMLTVCADSVLGIVATGILNVRSTSTTDSEVIKTLTQNAKVDILQESLGWYKVKSDTETGWVSAQYLTLKSDMKVAADVNSDAADVSEDPNLAGRVIDRVYKGNKVSVFGNNNGWLKVKSVGGLFGWVYGGLLTLGDNLASRGVIEQIVPTPTPQKSENKVTPAKATPVKATPVKATPVKDTPVKDTPEKAPPAKVDIKDGYANGGVVFVRNKNTITATPVDKIYRGDKLTVYSKSGDWYNIKTSSGKMGWVFDDYVSFEIVKVTNPVDSATTPQKPPIVNVSMQRKIVDYATSFIGCLYVYGAEGPKKFDCSGLVKYVYEHYGYDMNRVASDQAKQGVYVKKTNLALGDLIFFDTNGSAKYINHVGIYIGGGNMVHASSPRSKYVMVNDITSGYYSRYYVTARRIIK